MLRRSRLARLLGATLLAALLLPQAALAGAASASVTTTAPSADTTADAPRPVPFPLGCGLVIANPLSVSPAPAIACRWMPPAGVVVRAYRLYRIVDAASGGSRQLIATIPAGEPLRYADRNIAPGHAYTYRAVALGRDGTWVGLSNLVTVRFARLPELLRFGCAVVTDTDRVGVACRWSATTRPGADRYVLYRSVNGGAREAIYRTGIDGRRWFLDTRVRPGQTIRYAVIALSSTGRIVAIGGPDLVVLGPLATTTASPLASVPR